MRKLIAPTCLALTLIGGEHLLWAAQPVWWTDYSLVDGSTRQDSASATIGQAKHAVQKAYQYLEVELAAVGGSGVEVTAIYNNYCTIAPADSGNDLLPLTLGQLKFLAKPFYDRLNSTEVGLDTSAMNPASIDVYPWTVDQGDDADLALATIGQLKFVFSFDLTNWMPPGNETDTDNDGIPDTWEQQYFGNLQQGFYTDFDGDGIRDYYEFLLGFDPLLSDALISSEDPDSDGVINNEDAAPFDLNIGRVAISIAFPLDGGVVQ